MGNSRTLKSVCVNTIVAHGHFRRSLDAQTLLQVSGAVRRYVAVDAGPRSRASPCVAMNRSRTISNHFGMSHRLGLSSISVTLAARRKEKHKDEGEIIISLDVANLRRIRRRNK